LLEKFRVEFKDVECQDKLKKGSEKVSWYCLIFSGVKGFSKVFDSFIMWDVLIKANNIN